MNSEIPKIVLKRTYFNIKYRCENPSNYKFHLYGGRGIKFNFKDRNSFSHYIQSLNGWKKGFHLDRINTNGNYEEGNLRWVSNVVNTNNRRIEQFSKKQLMRGVDFRTFKRQKCYSARIFWAVSGKRKSKCLGIYQTEQEAHYAYVMAHIMLHGESVYKLTDYIKD